MGFYPAHESGKMFFDCPAQPRGEADVVKRAAYVVGRNYRSLDALLIAAGYF
jgi:hypothetical protein